MFFTGHRWKIDDIAVSYIPTHALTHIPAHTHTYTHTHIYTHIHTHTRTYRERNGGGDF